MAINLNTFRQAAQVGGRISLDQHHAGQLEASKGQIGGKVVTWFRDTFQHSAVKTENRAATQAFVDALRAEHGDRLGDMAESRLGDITRGKPLTGRKISQILDALPADRAKLNETTAKRAATVDDPARAGSFGQVFRQVSAALGSTRTIAGIDPDQLAAARRAIETAVKAAGTEGGVQNARTVDGAEAHAIATREVKKLLVADARDALARELATPGDASGGFDRAFAQGLADRGITGLTQADFALGRLTQAAQSAIHAASYNPAEGAHTRPVERADAQRLAQAKLDEFLDAKKAVLDKAKQLAGGNQAHEALLSKIAAGTEKMDPVMLEQIWGSRGDAEAAYKTLGDPKASLADQVKALRTLTQTVTTVAARLNFGAEDTNRFTTALFKTALESSGLDAEQKAALAGTFASPEMGALHQTLALPMLEPEIMESLGANGRAMIGLSSVILPLGEAAGVPDADLDREPIQSLADVPHTVLTALQAGGIDLPPPLGVGLSGSGEFGASAQAIIADKLRGTNEPLTTGGTTWSLWRDLSQPTSMFTITVGDQPLSKDPAEAVRQLRDFCKGPDGVVDENMFWAISQTAHRDTFDGCYEAMNQGKGPVRGIPDGRSTTAFDIARNDRGDLTIRAVSIKATEDLTDPETGDRTELASTGSFAINFEMKMNKADIDRRAIAPEMTQPFRYLFAFDQEA